MAKGCMWSVTSYLCIPACSPARAFDHKGAAPHLQQLAEGLLQARLVGGAAVHQLQALHAQQRHAQRKGLLQLVGEVIPPVLLARALGLFKHQEGP